MRPESRHTAPPPILSPDELPRARYELREEGTARPVTWITFGVVLANAFMFVKDLMYPKKPLRPGPADAAAALADAGSGERYGPSKPDASMVPANDDVLDPTDEAGLHDASHTELTGGRGPRILGSGGSSSALAVQGDQFVPIKQGLGGSVRPAPVNDHGNDNPLPDHLAQRFAGDAALARLVGGGSAGGGGNGHGGGSSGGGQGSGGSGSGGTGGGSDGPGVGDTVDDEEDDDQDGSGGGSGGDPRLNRAPIAGNTVYLYDVFVSQSVVIGLASLLQGSTDPDGDALTIRNFSASSGVVERSADGSFKFTAAPEMLGEVTFTYEITDGEFSVTQTAHLSVVELPGEHIIGTEYDDVLIGTPGRDVIEALGGDDDVIGREAADIIDGGAGNDRIFGGAGNDVIDGGDGNDVIFGGDGNDTINGGAGNDYIDGGAGNDVITAGDGDDTVLDGTGRDYVDLGAGKNLLIAADDEDADIYDASLGHDDTISFKQAGHGIKVDLTKQTAAAVPPVEMPQGGGDMSDAPPPAPVVDIVIGFENVIGSEFADEITGDGGNNELTGSGGDDVVSGEGGDDTLIATVDDADDTYDGGEGIDTYDLSQTSSAAVVNLASGVSMSGETGTDTLSGIENVVGSAGADVIVGDDLTNVLTGGGEDDIVAGQGGDDVLVATIGDGDDAYDGGDGNDTYDLSGTSAGATVDLSEGTSTSADTGSDLIENVENVVGSAGDDTITGDGVSNLIAGGGGDDCVAGGGGDDLIVATIDDGDDHYDGGDGEDTYDLQLTSAGAEVDLEKGKAQSCDIGEDHLTSIENVIGSQGDDEIKGDGNANVLAGSGGNDEISGGGGDDVFVMAAGDGCDDYDGGLGNDLIDASAVETSITIDLDNGFVTSSIDGAVDKITSIESAIGGKGNDIIIASAAQNDMWGGDGDDVFVFGSLEATSRGSGSRDRILDYKVGDRIDLDGILREFGSEILNDAIEDQNIKKFVLIKDGAEFTKPGELRILYETLDEGQPSQQTVAILQGNIDKDAGVDFEIEIHGLQKDEFHYS